jgi:hypothetical protein
VAKKKKQKGSVSGYFRQVFAEHPDWLDAKSNDAILAQYRTDHGMTSEASVEGNIKANLANLKSVLRKKRRRKGKGKSKQAVAVAATARGAHKLEGLEEMIDDSLTLAKNLDREGLNHVIHLLRRARNQVVWKMGES